MTTAPMRLNNADPPYTKAFEASLVRAVDGWTRHFIMEAVASGQITRIQALDILKTAGLSSAWVAP